MLHFETTDEQEDGRGVMLVQTLFVLWSAAASGCGPSLFELSPRFFKQSTPVNLISLHINSSSAGVPSAN